jgi:YegS/Rv2252/BmrU family lipid kinase
MESDSALVITNPAANRGRCGAAVAALRSAHPAAPGVRWVSTDQPGNATALATTAAQSGRQVVVAAGGDGTVHEIVNGLMTVPAAQRPALGLLPLGSGNDLAFNCGLLDTPAAALQRALHGTPTPLDAALIEDDAGRSRHYINVAGMLFDAAALMHALRIQYLRGSLIYLVAVLRTIMQNHFPTRVELIVDGELSLHSLLMLTLANGAREGGGFICAPQALPDDGWLDYVSVIEISRLQMLRLLPEFLRGTQGRFSSVQFKRGRTFEISADRAIPVHLDGELWADYTANVRRLRVTLLPGALRLMR